MNCAVHLEVAAVQPCERCGNFSCAGCLAKVGSVQFCGACRARAAELEWDRRRELGMFRAWWLTSKRMMVSPLQTLDVISPEGTVLESSIYAGICSLTGIVPTLLIYALFIGGAMAFGAMKADPDSPRKIGLLAGTGIGVGVMVLYLVMFAGFSVLYLLGSAGIELLILRLAGLPQARYSVSVRAHALSMAPYVIGVFPLCSLYVFPIWSLVLRVFSIHKLHRTTGGMGAASALIPLAVCCVSVMGLYAVMFAAIGLAGFGKR